VVLFLEAAKIGSFFRSPWNISSHPNMGGSSKSTNLKALLFAFASFLIFSIVQLLFGLRANSQAMVGDSITMILDAFTYLGNGLAEFSKAKGKANTQTQTPTTTPSRSSKTLLYLECVGPSFSVITLIAVTIYILNEALGTLAAEKAARADGVVLDDETDVKIMLLFASLNLGIDVVNVFVFKRNKDSESADSAAAEGDTVNFEESANNDEDETNGTGTPATTNMNMCSAYTHIFADTLRSIAVLVAALVSMITGASGEYCDAIAAIIVSVIIGCSAVPLIAGLLKLWFGQGEESDLCGKGEEDRVILLKIREEDQGNSSSGSGGGGDIEMEQL